MDSSRLLLFIYFPPKKTMNPSSRCSATEATATVNTGYISASMLTVLFSGQLGSVGGNLASSIVASPYKSLKKGQIFGFYYVGL